MNPRLPFLILLTLSLTSIADDIGNRGYARHWREFFATLDVKPPIGDHISHTYKPLPRFDQLDGHN
jgi:hypothetical protein